MNTQCVVRDVLRVLLTSTLFRACPHTLHIPRIPHILHILHIPHTDVHISRAPATSSSPLLQHDEVLAKAVRRATRLLAYSGVLLCVGGTLFIAGHYGMYQHSPDDWEVRENNHTYSVSSTFGSLKNTTDIHTIMRGILHTVTVLGSFTLSSSNLKLET